MLKNIARSVVTGTTVVALASGIIAAPQAQAQVEGVKTTKMTVNMACNLQIKRSGASPLIRMLAGKAEGTYNAGKFEQLMFTPTVTAPTAVEPNAKFDYVINPGAVGAPGQIVAAGFTIKVETADQLNVWIDLPKNAKVNDVVLEGGDPRVKYEIVNNRLRLYGKGLANESNPATWARSNENSWKHGGLSATRQRVNGEDMVVVNLPQIRLKMTATGPVGSTIQPSFDTADANKFPSSAFAQMYANASVVGQRPEAMARCGLSDRDSTPGAVTKRSDSFPAVTIKERKIPDYKANALVKVVKYTGEPVEKGTAVKITVDGREQTVTLGDNGTAALPELTLEEDTTKDVTIALADHPEVTQTVTLKGQEQAQPEAERTATLTIPRKSYPATLRVVVKDYLGNPVPGAEVKAGDEVIKADNNGVATTTRTLQEDATEELTVALVDDASVTATATLAGKKDAETVEVTLQKEAKQVDSTVQVTVVDTNGNIPPAGTKVALKNGDDVVTASTDAEGKAEFTTSVTEGTSVPAKVYLVQEETSSADITLTPGGTAKAELFLSVPKEEEKEDDTEAPTDVTRRVEVTVKRFTGETLPEGEKVELLVNGEAETGTVNKDGVIVLSRQLKSNENLDLSIALASAPDNAKNTRVFGGSDRVGSVQLVMEAQELDQQIIVTVKNFDGTPVANESVDTLIDDEPRTLTTDSEGRATVDVKVTEGQDKTFQVALKDNAEAKQAAVVAAKKDAEPARVTLTKAATDVEMPVTVTVRDEDGKPAANTPVEMLIGGETLTATSDDKGVATFTPTLTEGQRATAKIRVAGDGATPANVVLVGKKDAKPVSISVAKAPKPTKEPTQEPTPEETTPTTPTSEEPTPEETTPTTPTSEEPTPEETTPTTPTSEEPTPEETTPTTPTSEEPTPEDPDNGNQNPGNQNPGKPDGSTVSSNLTILWIILGTLLGGLGLGALAGWAKDTYNLPLPDVRLQLPNIRLPF